MDERVVKTSIREGVHTITLARPQVRNAVNPAAAQALKAAFKAGEANDDVLVHVLTGEGEHFCAGADLAAVAAREPFKKKGPLGPTWLSLNKPSIAAIEGYAVAGGLELALMCDLRVASESAIFGVFCRRFGVPLIDGGSVRLPRLIGASRAMDMILTGRPVSAKEAFMFGLANRVVPKGAALTMARTLAKQLTQFPQDCLRNDRASAQGQWGLSVDEALEAERALGQRSLKAGADKGADRFVQGSGRGGDFSGVKKVDV